MSSAKYVGFWLNFFRDKRRRLTCLQSVSVTLCGWVGVSDDVVYWCVDALQTGASQFESNAGRLKRKYWWQNIKVRFHFSRQSRVLDVVAFFSSLDLLTVSTGNCYRLSFYPRDAMLARVIEIATCLSVRLSVRHAPVLCQNEES